MAAGLGDRSVVEIVNSLTVGLSDRTTLFHENICHHDGGVVECLMP